MVLTESLSRNFLEFYQLLVSPLPEFGKSFVNFFLVAVFIFLIAILIWKFYKTISAKDIVHIDLSQYNKDLHPIAEKSVAGFFYFLINFIFTPLVVFLGFAGFTIFLILLTENRETSSILLLSATIVAAIRMTSYYKKDLAQDLAKLLPLTLVSVSLLNPDFFSIERIISQISEIPVFTSEILTFFFFIIGIETILRIFDLVFSIFEINEPEQEEEG